MTIFFPSGGASVHVALAQAGGASRAAVGTLDGRAAQRHTIRMNERWRSVILVLVVALHLAVNLAAVPVVHRWDLGDGTGLAWLVAFGWLVGQLSVLAAYWAWGHGHWVDRSIKSFFLTVLVWYAVTFGAVSTGDSFEVGSIEQILVLVVVLSFLYLSMAFWLTRAFARVRFALVSSDQLLMEASAPRFRVAHLLIWMAVAAVLCAIFQSPSGRELWASRWWTSSGEWVMILSVMALWAGLGAVLAIPAACVCLSAERLIRRLLFFAVYAGVIAAIAFAIAYAFWGELRSAFLVAGVPLGVVCEVVACALVFRMCGYRLVWKGRQPS
jgi:hypothetical protein